VTVPWLLGFQPGFEDGVLHPLAEVLESVGEAGSPAVVGYIIRDHDDLSRQD
jgi:hypothetical protein